MKKPLTKTQKTLLVPVYIVAFLPYVTVVGIQDFLGSFFGFRYKSVGPDKLNWFDKLGNEVFGLVVEK